MNNGLRLVKSADFMNVQCDFYQNQENTYCMTTEQLGMALGYSNPVQSIRNLIQRHSYLNNSDFKGVIKLVTPGGEQDVTIFTEDGIYEVTMLAKTKRAREFRAFVREVLKKLRDGSLVDSRAVLELVQTQKELMDKFNVIADRLIAATELPKLDYSRLNRSAPDHREVRLYDYKVEKLGCGEIARRMRASGSTYAEIIRTIKLKTGQNVTKSMLSRYFLAVKALN